MALRRTLLVHGVLSVDEYVRVSKTFTLDGFAAKIQCPMLVCDNENDEIALFAAKLYEHLSCRKDYIKFRG